MELIYKGNTDHLNLPKTAFQYSSNVPVSVVLKCYDRAME